MKNINHSLNNKIESEAKEFGAIFANAKTVSLSTQEKNQILMNLKNKMGGKDKTASKNQPIASPYYARPYTAYTRTYNFVRFVASPVFEWRLRKKTALLILIALIISYGSAASFAAEKSSPGDVLYPVKIYVNNWVKAAVSFVLSIK